MEINEELILKLEKLARLNLSSEDRTIIKDDLESILGMIDKLQEVDTENEEPLIYLSKENIPWRKDEIENEVERLRALKNASNATDKYFTVPKVLKL